MHVYQVDGNQWNEQLHEMQSHFDREEDILLRHRVILCPPIFKNIKDSTGGIFKRTMPKAQRTRGLSSYHKFTDHSLQTLNILQFQNLD